MGLVEEQAFKPNNFHRYDSDLYETITKKGDFGFYRNIALDLGFHNQTQTKTGKITWSVYDRPHYQIPIFPESSLELSSTLAISQDDHHAVLRSSKEPYPMREFDEDLANFTKHYFERPRFFGFPSKEMTGHDFRNAGIIVGLGMIPGVATMDISVITAGGLIGGMVSMLLPDLVNNGEKLAQQSISDIEQYTAGLDVITLLSGERSHRLITTNRKDLYQALQDEGFSYTPEDFMEKIYYKLPTDVIRQRYDEIALRDFPLSSGTPTSRNSLPRLIGMLHWLHTADLKRQEADNIESSLRR